MLTKLFGTCDNFHACRYDFMQPLLDNYKKIVVSLKVDKTQKPDLAIQFIPFYD